jgi:hypothetical protein
MLAVGVDLNQQQLPLPHKTILSLFPIPVISCFFFFFLALAALSLVGDLHVV